MSAPSPEERIRALVGDLRPVRRIPPLRIAAARTALPWLVAVALTWGFLASARPRPLSDPFWTSPGPLGILVGLVLVALGATSAALASAVPDRTPTMRRGITIAALGSGLALACALLETADHPAVIDSAWWRGCVDCVLHGVAFGLVSVLVTCRFIGTAAMRDPLSSAAMATAGGVALGAVGIHVACARSDGLHLLLSHALAPGIAAALLAVPLGIVLRRWQARRDRA